MTTQFLAAVECYKILVVEDDDGFAMLYDRFLKSTERRNYEIKRTTTAAQGIAACLEYDFDCLIVDYFLPDTSGTVMLNTL
ncbi:MAG: response regulator, partial [Granulosicoccus sp.]